MIRILKESFKWNKAHKSKLWFRMETLDLMTDDAIPAQATLIQNHEHDPIHAKIEVFSEPKQVLLDEKNCAEYDFDEAKKYIEELLPVYDLYKPF